MASITVTDRLLPLKQRKTKHFLQSELSTVLTRNKSLGQQISINVGINTLATTNPDDYGWNALGAVTGTLGAYGTDKGNKIILG